MRAVEEEYSKSGKTDSLFASYLTTKLGATVSTARVRQSRAALNVPSNAQQPASAQLTRLKTALMYAINLAQGSDKIDNEQNNHLEQLKELCV